MVWQVLQSDTKIITKGTAKCDTKSIQRETGITKCNGYYKAGLTHWKMQM